MIKTIGRLADGGHFVALGLSDPNWARLRAGQPILCRLRQLHPELPDVAVVLLGGDTETSLIDDLRAVGMWPGTSRPTDAASEVLLGRRRLLCPECGAGALWASDTGITCTAAADGGVGCGASWDACGYREGP